MSDPLVLRVPADCGLRAARALHDALATALRAAGPLVIDCAAVERADLSFVQLAVSARRTAERAGVSLTLGNPTASVLSAFARAGLPIDCVPHPTA